VAGVAMRRVEKRESKGRTERRGNSLTNQAYAILHRDILTCQIVPGQELSEQETAQRLSMSKTPVREALARLNLEGFVEIYPRRGYRVAPVTVKDMIDLFALRGVMEGAAAAMAVRNMMESDFEALERLAAASYVVDEAKSLEAFVEANRAFHSAIAFNSGNPRIHRLITGLLIEAERFFFLGARARDVNPETSNDHRKIVAVLRRRDPEKARQIMIQHSDSTLKGLMMSMVSNGQPLLTF
jgi:DNA-binding GntR family transcriptional regulator